MAAVGTPGHNDDRRRGGNWAILVALAAGLWAAVATAAVADVAPAERPADVLTHASADAFWLAEVEPHPSAGAGDPAEQTTVRMRLNKPLQPWRTLSVLPGRAVSLAAHDSQLAVLLSDGRWVTVWPEGTATGQPLPADGVLRTLADDGRAIWAVGLVPGGKAAADAYVASRATSQPGPTTLSAMPTVIEATRPVSKAPKLVVFRQVDGRWAAVTDLPEPVPATDAGPLSLAVADDVPLVAYRSAAGRVRTLAWSAAKGGAWADRGVGDRPTTRPVARFDLLVGAAGPLLWTTAGVGDPGQVQSRSGPIDGQPEPDAPRTLVWPAGQAGLTATPAATVAGNYLRVVGPTAPDGRHDEVDQRYGFDGLAIGLPAAVAVPGPAAPSVAFWAKGMVAVMLAFAVATSVLRQNVPAMAGGTGDAAGTTVVPAPLGRRAAAGAIDLLPVVVAAVIADVSAGSVTGEMSLAMQGVLIAGVAVYLLHTAVLEGLTARSAGKWITGLRVATVDGGRPAAGVLVGRNLLRAVDPLVFIALSPLRQRTADLLLGTVVVSAAAPKPTAESGG